MLSREERLKQNQEALAKRIQSDAAYIRQVEAEREKREKIDQYKAYQQARVEQANRNNQAIQYAREAAREEYQTNLPEYREQERERWKATTQAWREAENARKYYDTRSAETNAREKQRRANAMKDYTALQAQRDNYEYKKNVERAPYQYARQVGYDRDEIRSLDQKYTSLNQRTAALEYDAQKALKNDIPKMQNVMDTEKKYGTQDSARAIAGMIETGGAFDPKKNYSGAGKESQAQLIAKTVYLSAIGGVPDPTGRLSFNTEYMTDSEKAVILKMAYAGDLDQLYQYANDLIPVLDAREYDAKQQQISQMSRPMQVAYGMTGTIASPLAYAQMGIDTLRGGYTDLNSGAVAATRLAQTARAKSLENASPVGQFMGNVAYSMADNLVSMSLGQTGALIWLGLSAAGNEGVNALENGATQKQAFAKATASGLIETATEKMGIDNLFDIAKKSGSRGIKSMLLDIAKQAGAEGTEEIISEFANAFADAAIMGQESDFNKAVRAYEAENMSHDEALKKATLEFFVKNPAMAGLAGAVSGALFGVGGVTAQQSNQIRADRAAGQQITNRENVGGSFEDVVLAEGMKSSDKRIASKAVALDAIRHENRSSEGFKWSKSDQRAIGEIYDSLDADAKARIGVESNRRMDAAIAEQNKQEAEQDKAIAAREAEMNAEQQQTAADDADAELDAEEAELAAQYERMQQESGETVDMDNPQTVQNTAAEEQQTQRTTEAEEFDRLAAAAEEATRTGDTSVLDRAAQDRPVQNTAAQTAQPTQETQRTTAQPVTPEQAGQQTANNARKAGLSAEDTLALSNVARQIGVGLDFEDIRDSRIDGYYDRVTGRVVLNKNLSSADMAWTTFAHEITHRAESAQSYGQLVNVAKAYVTRDADPENADRTWRGFVNGTWQEYMSAGIKVDRQGAEFESVARTIEAILGSRESIEAVARYSREDAQALLASINDVLDNTTENGTAVTPESARLVQAQKVLAAALSEVREQNRYKADNSANDAANSGKVQFSISRDTEQQYEDAVKRGDMDTAQKMVDETAKKAMASSKIRSEDGNLLPVFHGTSESFTVFDMNKSRSTMDIQGSFFSPWEIDAGGYGENVGRYYLNITNPASESIGYAALRRFQGQNNAGTKAREYLKSKGYDGVNNGDEEYIAFYPEQIKSADPVTYDDNGNVIPLSERFNPEDQDIRRRVSGFDLEADIRKAVERYGKLKGGEQLYYVNDKGEKVYVTSKVDLPKGTSAETRTRGFNRTVAESNNIKADTRDLAVANQYRPTSNEENVRKAEEMRGTASFEQALGTWNTLVRSGRLSYKNLSVDIAFGERLLLEAQKKGNADAVRSIITDLAEIGTTFGQATQAFSLLKRMSPEGQLVQYKREGDRYYEKLNRHGKYTNKKAKRQVDYSDNLQKAEDAFGRLEDAKKKLSDIKKDKNHTAAQIKKAEADIASINNEIKRALADLAKAKQDWRHTRGVLIRTQLNRRELNREIKATQDRIENALAEIPKLQTEIDRLQGELWALENKETKKKAERDALRDKRKELKTKRDNMMARIATLSRQIPQLQADIDSLFSQMAIGEDNEADMRSYRDVLKKSRSIMQEYLRYVKRKGSVIIPQDLQDEYVNAKTDDERAVALTKIEQSIADQLPGTWAEKIRAVRYISMLFNPTTHERNILGNATQFGFVKTRDVLATLGEMAFLRNGEERTHAFMGGRKSADAKYWEAADADYKEMMAIVQGNRTDIGAHLEEMRRIFKSAFMEKIRTTSSNTLEAEDRFWLSRHYKSAFAQYLKSNNLDPSNLTEEQLDRARTIAVQQAQKATYRDYSAFADQLNRLEKSSAAAEFFMGGLMPFKKTPLNVLKRGVEYSPLGAFKTAADFIKLKRGDTTVTAADAINDAAQTLTGTLATSLGILLGALGWAHASPGEDDKDRKKNFDKATGMQNYSIEIPGYDENGKWSWKAATYTVDWLSPFSMPLFIGVRIAELVKGQDGGLHSFQDFVDAASSIAEPVFQLSMLDGLTSALQSYQSSGAGVARSLLWSVAESYALQFFPTLGSKMARIIDPTQRSTKAFKYSTWFGQDLERLYRRVFAKIPGLSYTLKPVIDKNGDFKKNVGSNVLERIAYNLASPGYFSYKTKSEEDAETSRLYDALIGTDPELANAILPKEINTSWELNGEKYYLNAETYKRFAETQGKEETAGRKALYASDAYKAATDAEKASMIKRVLDDAQEKAKIGFFEDIGLVDEYYRSQINDSVYEKDGTPKNTTAVTDLYESDALDLAAVYRGEKALTGLSQKDDKTNALKAQNLSEDEYNFLYMTHVMTTGSQRDDVETMTQQIGLSLTQAIQIAEGSYDYNEKGEYAKTVKRAAEAILAADVTDEQKGLSYLQWAISNDDRASEEKKMQIFYENNLTASDYIKSKATLTGLSDTKISTKTGALLESDLSQEAKETAFLTMVSESKDYEAAIPAFKRKNLTVDDFLRSVSVINGTDSKAIGTKARALLDSGLSDTIKETAFLSIVSDAQEYVNAMPQFKKAGMGVNDFLRCVEAFSGDGMNNAKKTDALMRLNVKSPLTVVTSMITSGNKVEGLWQCKDAGISEKDIVKAYAQFAKIDTKDIKAKEKAEEFAYWVDTNMQLSDAHRDLLVDTMVYYTSVPAKATNYLKYSDMPNVSSSEARYISEDLAALVPREGKDSVNDWQRVIAIANDKRLTSAASEQAIYGILDNKDDGKESSALTKYKDVVSKGVSPVMYATFREKVASYTSDYDANGKAIAGKSKKDKILAVINSYADLSRTQKDALYYSCDYSGKTINEAPWH